MSVNENNKRNMQIDPDLRRPSRAKSHLRNHTKQPQTSKPLPEPSQSRQVLIEVSMARVEFKAENVPENGVCALEGIHSGVLYSCTPSPLLVSSPLAGCNPCR